MNRTTQRILAIVIPLICAIAYSGLMYLHMAGRLQ